MDLLLNSLAYVEQVSLAMEGNFRLRKILAGFHHRNALGGSTSQRETLKSDPYYGYSHMISMHAERLESS